MIHISYVFFTCFFCFCVRFKTGLSTIISILYTHLFSTLIIMTFDYDFCCVSVQKHKLCIFCWYIYVFYDKTNRAGYIDYSAVVCILTAKFKDTKLT